jgi:hypothetical protein
MGGQGGTRSLAASRPPRWSDLLEAERQRAGRRLNMLRNGVGICLKAHRTRSVLADLVTKGGRWGWVGSGTRARSHLHGLRTPPSDKRAAAAKGAAAAALLGKRHATAWPNVTTQRGPVATDECFT